MRTEAFFRKLGMPLSITELLNKELGEEELAALAEECTYGRKRTIGGFKVLDYDDILKIYHIAK